MSNFVYRIPPCPSYDIEGMESWLEDMAAKGYVLGQEGIFPGIVAFEKTEPKQYKYRLIASAHKYGHRNSRLGRYAPVPDEKTQDFHREFGWDYVATRRDFSIYCAKDPNAPEMDSDPQIQALAVGAAAKRQLVDIFCYSLIVLMNAALTLWLGYGYLTGVRDYFRFSGLMFAVLWLLLTVQCVHSYIRLNRLKKSLLSGQTLTHRSDYRRSAPKYWTGQALRVVFLVFWIFLIWNTDTTIRDSDHWIALDEYTGDIPFATMEELLPESQFREDPSWGCYITVKSTPLSETYELRQKLHITLPDGTETSGSLDVVYLETNSPASARFMADKEYRRGIRADYDPTELNIEGIDYAFYYNYYSFDYVVLCKGSAFLSVNFHIYEGDPITPEEIGKIMAGSIP